MKKKVAISINIDPEFDISELQKKNHCLCYKNIVQNSGTAALLIGFVLLDILAGYINYLNTNEWTHGTQISWFGGLIGLIHYGYNDIDTNVKQIYPIKKRSQQNNQQPLSRIQQSYLTKIVLNPSRYLHQDTNYKWQFQAKRKYWALITNKKKLIKTLTLSMGVALYIRSAYNATYNSLELGIASQLAWWSGLGGLCHYWIKEGEVNSQQVKINNVETSSNNEILTIESGNRQLSSLVSNRKKILKLGFLTIGESLFISGGIYHYCFSEDQWTDIEDLAWGACLVGLTHYWLNEIDIATSQHKLVWHKDS
ncbi:hypothetical protein DID75_01315 [Candidatus Marinamargulisbacteria bacterium SCGC AG-410-N11]|nr:hypothetical protein DID75_01315 [Candidatus Marinamargulisbacteria bacterium SCGC AG-410-N11]